MSSQEFQLFSDWLSQASANGPIRVVVESTLLERLSPILTAVFSGAVSAVVALGTAWIAIRSNNQQQRDQRAFDWNKFLVDRRAEHAERAVAAIEIIVHSRSQQFQALTSGLGLDMNERDVRSVAFRTIKWFIDRRAPHLAKHFGEVRMKSLSLDGMCDLEAKRWKPEVSKLPSTQFMDAQIKFLDELAELRRGIADALEAWERHPS